MEKLREFTEADLEERRTRLAHAGGHRAGVERHLGKTQARGTHVIAKTGLQKGEPIQIEEPITIKNLSAALGVKSNDILTKLMRQGVFALEQDAPGTLTWLGAHARRWSRRCLSAPTKSNDPRVWWSRRAANTADVLDALVTRTD